MVVELSSAMRWWEEWPLRALVLSSASLQLFLFFVTLAHANRISSWLRSCIWLAYIGSDTLAIYALATLFNRHRAPPVADTGTMLEILWAPVLLVHLGGRVTISAYNMEDNELWTWHVLSFLSQGGVALYVFCKSWQPGPGGERLLLWAAVLLFAIGVIRFSMKPLALKRASINSLAPSHASVTGRRKVFTFFDQLSSLHAQCTSDALYWSELMQLLRDEEQAVAALRKELDGVNDISLEDYVREAKIGAETEEVTTSYIVST